MPITSELYWHPRELQEEISKQIAKFERDGIIEPSDFPLMNPVLCISKKMDASNEQKYRIVIDIRKANEHNLHDNYPLRNIDEILDQLGETRYFSAFDLASEFYEIPMHPRDRHKTAFSTQEGH